MSDERTSTRSAFLTADEGVEQIELTGPWSARPAFERAMISAVASGK